MRIAISLLAIAMIGLASGAARGADSLASLFLQIDANQDGVATADEAGVEHARIFSRLLALGDKDGDGQLTAEEWRTALAPRDGAAGGGASAPQARDAAGGRNALILLLARMDVDGDGRVTVAEVPPDLAPYFSILIQRTDNNKNRELNAEEVQEHARLLGLLAQAIAARLRLDVAAELAALPAAVRARLEAIVPAAGDDASPPVAAGPSAAFTAFDVNSDGSVTTEEAMARLSEFVARADADNNGVLNEEEVLRLTLLASTQRFARGDRGEGSSAGAAAGPRRSWREVHARLDANSDGQLSPAELPPPLARRLGELDSDGDGQLSADELARSEDPRLP